MVCTGGGSKSGSKTNLNESTVPLLEEGGKVEDEKESIELKEKDPEGGDSKEENEEGGKGKKKKKKDKEKKEKKEKDEKCKRYRFTKPNIVNSLTIGLNMLDRDDRKINDAVNVSFEDVLGEPDASHGLGAMWKLVYITFNFTKRWIYTILGALLGFPLALIWGVVFAIVCFLHIWIISPVLRLLDVFFNIVRKASFLCWLGWGVRRGFFFEMVCGDEGKMGAGLKVNYGRRWVW
ncbi:unnamed protein product [Darwinula stevensoni]|uniref:Caveolin n=1 Tax=Darwinula stevensoni TaxID=69355 RepID=A0A7R9AFM1_9CRUS|nr:unnamed protein product [Darwinula stevensoni]CAG0902554.1 unnamed protein product [Darwinula stevensoni]